MQEAEGFLSKDCSIFPLNEEILSQCQPFSCGDKDLDDFFLNDAAKFNRQLLGKSFCFRLKADLSVIVCAFTLSTSSIDGKNLPGSRRRKLTENIPHEKSLSSYPAALIGRLGVNKDFRKKRIGKELIENVIKPIFRDFQIGCRYLTVDAYNNDAVLKFYESSGFRVIFSTEKQEKEYIGLSEELALQTRTMYFDLIRLFDKSD
ncbi:MAG: GNAT family N-acetyltransferase [Tannerella sp.]|jgi:GNAT superfamily N-acetyltransferase|nr:GNAT family N-acetyltransferase [Tannerella sp.]